MYTNFSSAGKLRLATKGKKACNVGGQKVSGKDRRIDEIAEDQLSTSTGKRSSILVSFIAMMS